MLSNPILGQTVGIEIETDYLLEGDIRDIPYNPLNMKYTHDATCESPAIAWKDLIFSIDSDVRFLQGWSEVVVGSELISGIIDTERDEKKFISSLMSLTHFLEDKGEPPTSERSSLHIHVSLPNPNVRILKNALRLGGFFEPLFFNLGGMGYNFRGEKNNSIFCRPLSSPQLVPYKPGIYAYSLDLEDLTSIKSFPQDDFWNMYGDLHRNRKKYTPVRYSWLSLYSLYPEGQYKGTLEFRIFNKSLNPLYIWGIIEACKAFTNSTLMSLRNIKKYIKINSIFSDYSIQDLLTEFVILTELEDKVVYILEEILSKTPKPLLDPIPVKSHLLKKMDFGYFWSNNDYKPRKIFSVDECKDPTYIDIHNFERN